MFGYIRPYKGELKVSEADFYQSVYCGLCKRLKENYGLVSTFTLNYDFTFLALLKMSLSDKQQQVIKKRCVVYHTTKRLFCVDDEAIDFAAGCATIILHYKAKDNFVDNGFWDKVKAGLYLPFSNSHMKKVDTALRDLNTEIGQFMANQAEVEKQNTASVDLASDNSAKALSAVFSYLSEDALQKQALERFGYLLGRWVYFMDALDDLEDDLKKNNFNPFLNQYNLHPGEKIDFENIFSEIEPTLNLTIGEIANTFHLLDIKQYKPMLENIIFLGLNSTQQMIKNKRSNNDE